MKSLTQLIAGLNIVEPLKGYPFLDFSALYQCSIIELLFAFKKNDRHRDPWQKSIVPIVQELPTSYNL